MEAEFRAALRQKEVQASLHHDGASKRQPSSGSLKYYEETWSVIIVTEKELDYGINPNI